MYFRRNLLRSKLSAPGNDGALDDNSFRCARPVNVAPVYSPLRSDYTLAPRRWRWRREPKSRSGLHAPRGRRRTFRR